MDKPVLAVVAVAALVAAVVWGRSAQRMQRVWQRIEDDLGPEADATVLARSSYRKELHTVTLYAVLAVASAVAAVLEHRERRERLRAHPDPGRAVGPLRARLPPRGPAGRGPQPARAPRRGGALPGGAGAAPLGRPPGPGGPARLRRLRARPRVPSRHRPHGRRLLRRVPRGADPHRGGDRRRHRPRHRAVDHRLPGQVPAARVPPPVPRSRPRRSRSSTGRCRRSSASRSSSRSASSCSTPRPPRCAWRRPATPPRGCGTTARSARCAPPVRCSCSTPTASTPAGRSRSTIGDLLLLYTDGLAEARAGEQLFGEDRVANTLRRDPGVPPDVLCKSLLEAARDFATEPMTDDVAILAIQRT